MDDQDQNKATGSQPNEGEKKGAPGHTPTMSPKEDSTQQKNGLGDHTNNGDEKPGNRTDRALGDSDEE